MTQIFLLQTGAAGSWPDPGNWNPANNTIDCLGSGGNGLSGDAALNNQSGGGGGGGAWCRGTNRTLSFPVPYWVSPGGAIGQANDPSTNFGSSTQWFVSGAGIISAKGGQKGLGTSGVSGAGGNGGTVDGSATGYAGGSGVYTAGQSAGGGGGGSAGPHGPGSNGIAGSGTTFGRGGNADNNNTTGQTTGGGNGLPGTQFDSTHGCGSGAAGGSDVNTKGGVGGLYGGGGGGGYMSTGTGKPGGLGGDGLIVITYTPLSASQTNVMTSL